MDRVTMDAPAANGRALLSEFLHAPFSLRTMREALYLSVATMLAVGGGIYLLCGTVGGLFLAVTVIGIPLIAVLVVGARGFGHVYRLLSGLLLDTPVSAPVPFVAGRGTRGYIRSGFTDRVGWRTALFLSIKTVLGVFSGVVLAFAVTAAFLVIAPLPWWLFDTRNYDSHGTARHSIIQFGEDMFFDSWTQMLTLSAVGIACVFLAPWPIRGLVNLDRMLIRLLLGPSPRDTRVEQLERARTAVVEDAAATLRRVERDLHDGAQARLVAIAMTLGRAEERITTGDDPSDLLSSAHSAAKEALVELREVVRGIHPPALDLGLGAALETLAARSAVPAELDVSLPERPSPGIETIAYFSVAELLTNVARHSDASQVWVSAVVDGSALSVVVTDNGSGGATMGSGSGLRGLAARAATVDGSLHLSSPVGGPTVVTITLPIEGKH
ncbi:sensor histidine kinase [Rhodococcus oryzae]|uniref:sensor histidine kinase n=1 Tax=Rhodococcus oryzae TaxID=2571143 RepID=UPI00371EEDD8